VRVESNLERLEHSATLQYVRGCAALAAFPAGSISLARVEEVHAAFANLVGASEWQTWGSEQIASNFLVANVANAEVLPASEYCSHFPDGSSFNYDDAAMIHFIGSHRFDNGTYRRLASRVVTALQAQ
jgi:hypothetical protein